jgi:exosortase/archaeosortase family protein
MFGPCSSFHNISLGLLCWVAITKLRRPDWAPGDAWVAALVVVAVVLLNTGRVYLMALSAEMYDYWHTGFGAHLFALVASAAVIAISVWGALRRAHA